MGTPMRTPVNTPEQGADLFFQAALQYGYRYVFGNPGTTEAVFMDALVAIPTFNLSSACSKMLRRERLTVWHV